MFHDFKFLINIVFDCDFKFFSFFWRIIWNKLDIDLLTVSAYHQQIDGQAKCINQFIKIALKFHLFIYSKNVHLWHKILSYIQMKMNNVKHVKTNFTFNKLVYKFKIWNFLNFLWNLSSKNYFKTRQYNWNKIKQILIFANVYAKKRYNAQHKFLKKIKMNDKMYFYLHHEYKMLK